MHSRCEFDFLFTGLQPAQLFDGLQSSSHPNGVPTQHGIRSTNTPMINTMAWWANTMGSTGFITHHPQVAGLREWCKCQMVQGTGGGLGSKESRVRGSTEGMGKAVDTSRKFWYIPKDIASAVQTDIERTRFIPKDPSRGSGNWEGCIYQPQLPQLSYLWLPGVEESNEESQSQTTWVGSLTFELISLNPKYS